MKYLLLLLTACTPHIEQQSFVEKGRNIMLANNCMSCHSIDGSRLVGPTLKGLYESKVELTDGTTVIADKSYLRESIKTPSAKIVKGYSPMMPSYKDVLKETEITLIIQYIKSLK